MKELPTKIDERLKELEVRVSDLKQSDRWRSWLKFSAKMHRYSFTNSMLIHLCHPGATIVMGYGSKDGTTGWKSVGRQVIKGSRGIPIFAPRFRKEGGERADHENDGGTVLAGFHVVHVFDVSQTEGDPIPDQPEWPTPTVCPPGLFEKLRATCNTTFDGYTGLSIWSKGADELGEARGCLRRKEQEIFVLQAEEPQMVATVLHELGHWFDPFLQENPSAYGKHRADCELVAESVMWLTSEKAGIDSDDEVEHYLASWSDGEGELFSKIGDSEILELSQRIQKSFIQVDGMLTRTLEAM